MIDRLQNEAENAWKRWVHADWKSDHFNVSREELQEASVSHRALEKSLSEWQCAKHDLCPKCEGMFCERETGVPCKTCGGTGLKSERWNFTKGNEWVRCSECQCNHVAWNPGPEEKLLLPPKKRELPHLCIVCFRQAVGARETDSR